MQVMSLRWALRMGALAAVVGFAAQLVSGWFQPSTSPTTVDREVQYVVVAGTLLLVAIGVTLGLAYYAGMRTERERASRAPSAPNGFGGEGRYAAWAGASVVAAYWLVTTLMLILAPHHPGDASVTDLLTGRIVLLVILLGFGYGLGALGGRAPAAHNLLDEIASAPRSSLAPPGGVTTPVRTEDAGPAASEPNARADNEV
jgi:hypothetical protein